MSEVVSHDEHFIFHEIFSRAGSEAFRSRGVWVLSVVWETYIHSAYEKAQIFIEAGLLVFEKIQKCFSIWCSRYFLFRYLLGSFCC